MAECKVAVVGTGYVGLTTGACLAEFGHDVVCLDIDSNKIDRLSSGEIPIYEDGLQHLVSRNTEEGRLRFTTNSAALDDREFAYLCVPTPRRNDGSVDLSFLESAVDSLRPHLRPGAVVINKSTVPVRCTRFVEDRLRRPDVSVVSNPEFLREGSAVADFLKPDRVVIGSDDREAASRVASLYLETRAPIMITDAASAETIKYVANAFLATKLSFANSVAALCEAVGAEASEVLLGIGYDGRIGHQFLRPGPGWGGSCFPKDTRALVHIADEAGYDFALLRSVIETNETQFARVVDRIGQLAPDGLEGASITVLGLTFKAGTDDLRESPALEIVDRLIAAGATVTGYDPTVIDAVAPSWDVAGDPYSACEGSDVVAVLTEWDEFKDLDLQKVADAMRGDVIFDARSVVDRARATRCGLRYAGIGTR